MAPRGTTFAKQERDRAKKDKAARKRERRQARRSGEAAPDDEPLVIGDELPPAELLRLVEELHQRYADGRISFEDFEERKAELMARVSSSI
jgi:hypothetical protein